jgi:hypothetical protein
VEGRIAWTDPEGAKWRIEGPETFALAPREATDLAFRLAGEGDPPDAALRFVSDGNVVFVHRIPVRAVPETTVRAGDGAGTAQIIDEAVRFGFSRDGENLYLDVRVEGVASDAAQDGRTKRDSYDNWKADSIHVYLDPEGREERFFHFAATPAGGLTDSLWTYEPFRGHHARNTKWDGSWSVEGAIEDGVWTARIAIPFETLGGAPGAGAVWRGNVAVHRTTEGGKATSHAWADDGAARNPEIFGRLTFAD